MSRARQRTISCVVGLVIGTALAGYHHGALLLAIMAIVLALCRY